MTFTLTDTLADEIQNALENQEQTFLVDAQENVLVEQDGSVSDDGARYYKLPEWTSADGFAMRDEFAKNLYSPLARERLLEALHSGRGVFRNFRNVLKDYPEVDRKWHSFKFRTMQNYISGWYNGLCEIWGLEKLDLITESDSSLVRDDFSFRAYAPDNDRNEILLSVGASVENYGDDMPDYVGFAFYELWRNQFEFYGAAICSGVVCRSPADEFAGCITSASVSKSWESAVVLTAFFVPRQFRGLGIGTELLSECLADLRKRGKKLVLLPETIVPEFIQSLLLRNGFKKTGSGYAAVIGG